MKKPLFVFLLLQVWLAVLQAQTFKTSAGSAYFKSDAPLELIEAESKKMRGVLDGTARTFAFSVDTKSFRGFNGALQREHFYENYLEAEKFPVSTFSGKLIESVDFSKPGTYTVRAKGKMVIHGVTQERIIKSTVVVSGKTVKITTEFTVLLEEYNIRIPKIINQKIAKEIVVRISAELTNI